MVKSYLEYSDWNPSTSYEPYTADVNTGVDTNKIVSISTLSYLAKEEWQHRSTGGNSSLNTVFLNTQPVLKRLERVRGKVRYELKNFRGDIRQIISDVKYREEVNGVVEYTADVWQVEDSYPFGWSIKDRSFTHPNPEESYRFGFNGKENDKDFGEQLIQDYGFRLYNPAIGKFLSVDPLAPEYPWYTPYQFAGNMPISAVDLDGLEPELSIEQEVRVTAILSNPPADVVAYQAGVSQASWNAAGLGIPDYFRSDPYYYSDNSASQRSYLQGRISGDLFVLGLGVLQIHGGGGAVTGSPGAGILAPVVAGVGEAVALYGASRLGVKHYSNNWITYAELTTAPKDMTESLVIESLTEAQGDRGHKVYELSNHLGNVLATVSDKKLGQILGGSIVASYYEAQVQSASDYYPFGWQIPSRKVTNGKKYTYGFNGQLEDEEWNGGQSVNFLFRVLDPRIGRFLSVDPLAPSYPWYTPYQFAGNMPIWAMDLEGAEPEKKASGEGEGTSEGNGGNIPMSKGGKCGGSSQTIVDKAKQSKETKRPEMGTEVTRKDGKTVVYLESGEGDNYEYIWYEKPEEYELDKLENNIREGIEGARDEGFKVAADNLERFMDGVGGTKIEDVNWLKNRPFVQQSMKKNYERFMSEVHSSGVDQSIINLGKQLKDGESVYKPIDEWYSQIDIHPLNYFKDPQLYWAYGISTIKSKGSFYITRNGNTLTVVGVITHTFIDDYNWHIGKSVIIRGDKVKDENMLLMQVYKGAKPFDVRTEWMEKINKKYEIK